ncbi:MAG: helix-turn-helix domain-containing protein, partial [Myxococcota bacterium]
WVRDLGSTEGTRVNGQPIDGRTVLEPSDLVGIGQHLLRVHSSADRTAAPGPALAEALAHLPEDLAQRLRAEALADRWEADAWRSLVSDPGAWLDHIDDREALLASIEAQLEAWGVADQLGTIDDDFAARSLPSSLGAAVKRRVQALQRWVGPLLTRAVPVRDLRTATKRFQLGQLARALEATGGNRAQAAERLGVSRQFIYRLLDHEES